MGVEFKIQLGNNIAFVILNKPRNGFEKIFAGSLKGQLII